MTRKRKQDRSGESVKILFLSGGGGGGVYVLKVIFRRKKKPAKLFCTANSDPVSILDKSGWYMYVKKRYS